VSERLVLEQRGSARAPVELPRAGVLVIGSDGSKAGLVLTGEGIDGAHCAIARAKGGGWGLRDLGSRVGTLLNGQRVGSARLAAGDALRIGEHELFVVDPAAVRDSAAPPKRDDETREVELDTPVALPGLSAPAEAPRTALPTIGGYKVERTLGRGGMGQVYLAIQESLARQVALKVLAPRLAADAEFVRRFQAEARAAAALNHPNIVTVYDVGEDRGTHYLSMEYMDRGNLEDRISKGGRLPWAEALDVLRDAAQGLSFAEGRRIVHRDLKPANLMQNSVGQTKIADLGLATHLESEESQTAEKKVFGTPHFMSPEQARGERVDSRSDLYSLGATAYRLLTAHTPFEGANAKEIVRAHLTEAPRPMRDFAADLPEGVVALVARLMQKDPGARFQTAGELVRELERLRGAGGAAGGAVSSAAPSTRPRERARSGSKALAFLILAGALAAGGYWYYDQLPKPPPTPPTTGNRTPAPARPQDPVVPAAPAGPLDAPEDVAARGSTTEEGPRTTPRPPKPVDDDAAAQQAEAAARAAYDDLLRRDPPLERRTLRDELRLLATRHAGTTAASEALARADELAVELAQSDVAAQQQSVALDDLLGRLRGSAGLDKTPPEPGKALLALRSVDSQGLMASDPLFQAAKKELEREILANASRYVDGQLGLCDEAQARGDFDLVEKRLRELEPVLDLPEFPLGEGPAGVAEFMRLGRSARERLRMLELTRVKFTETKRQEDTKLIAVSFGGPQGLERELRALELAAARERLSGTAARMSQPESKAYLEGLAVEVGRAQSALELLAREFARWRRKAFVDPRERKGATRNAAGVDANGIVCEPEGGRAETIPWSAFGGNTRDLGRLFHERLEREYSAEEKRAIAALLRLNAVVEAVDLTSKMFDPARRVNFTETNARELTEAYEPALDWARRAGEPQPAEREVAAATQLAQVLLKLTEGSYSIAVTGTERLLADAQDTLLVRLLSDGSPARAAVPPPTPAPPPDAKPPPGQDPPKDGRR